MDKETQIMVGQMSLIAFCILIFVSIIVSYGCVYMSSTDEIVPNQERHVGFNAFSGMYEQTEESTSRSCN
jgi:hypothetical protein